MLQLCWKICVKLLNFKSVTQNQCIPKLIWYDKTVYIYKHASNIFVLFIYLEWFLYFVKT